MQSSPKDPETTLKIKPFDPKVLVFLVVEGENLWASPAVDLWQRFCFGSEDGFKALSLRGRLHYCLKQPIVSGPATVSEHSG